MFSQTLFVSSVHKHFHILVQKVRNWARPETLSSLSIVNNSSVPEMLAKAGPRNEIFF